MTDPFFPNQSHHVLEQEARVRRVVPHLAEFERLEVYSALSNCVPSFANTTYRIESDVVIACQDGREIAFPRPVPPVKLSIITFGYEKWLERKYCMPGFVEVEAGDIVIDCGAYVGGFSLSAAKIASELHAFEPEQANATCVRRNLAGMDHVCVVEAGLYSVTGQMTLNVSESSVEHSLLQPDDNTLVEQRRVPVISLRDYARTKAIEQYDFIKIEAEGVELEVFDGLDGMLPQKLAIDVSAERDGKSPANEFQARLLSLGYEVRRRGSVMFGRFQA